MADTTPICLTSIAGGKKPVKRHQTGQSVSSVYHSVTLASPQGNGGFGEDNRYLRAYKGRAGLLEAESGFPVSTLEAYRDGLPREGLETEFPVLLDVVAKRSEGQNEGLSRDCPSGFITGHCENGHRFAKEVYCGKEWCEVCNGKWARGQDMKPSHARRFARWYPKAQQIGGMGYWTFTIPLQARGRFRTKQALGKLGHDVQELLKEAGFDRGLRRWHWFGDNSPVYHPHLNCLVDGGRLGKRELKAIRQEYSALLGVKLAIAEYHYVAGTGQKVHALKYVTRATFLDAKWDIAMALELRGFRNQLWWGSKLWSGEPVWSLDDLPAETVAGMSDSQARAVGALELGYCPHDGLKIEWSGYHRISELAEMKPILIGAGYYELPGVSPPSYRIDFSEYERMCYCREVVSTAQVLSGLPPLGKRYGVGANLAWFKRQAERKAENEQAWTERLAGQSGEGNDAS